MVHSEEKKSLNYYNQFTFNLVRHQSLQGMNNSKGRDITDTNLTFLGLLSAKNLETVAVCCQSSSFLLF